MDGFYRYGLRMAAFGRRSSANIKALELFYCFSRVRLEKMYGRAYDKECMAALYIISFITAVNDPNQTNNFSIYIYIYIYIYIDI